MMRRVRPSCARWRRGESQCRAVAAWNLECQGSAVSRRGKRQHTLGGGVVQHNEVPWLGARSPDGRSFWNGRAWQESQDTDWTTTPSPQMSPPVSAQAAPQSPSPSEIAQSVSRDRSQVTQPDADTDVTASTSVPHDQPSAPIDERPVSRQDFSELLALTRRQNEIISHNALLPGHDLASDESRCSAGMRAVNPLVGLTGHS